MEKKAVFTSIVSQRIIEIGQPDHHPLDTVQAIAYFHSETQTSNKYAKMFFTGGWDGILRAYNLQGKNKLQICLQKKWHFYQPILSLDIKKDGSSIVVGLGNGQILLYNLLSSVVSVLGSHESPICNAFWLKSQQNTILSFGYDKVLKIWNDTRNQSILIENLKQGKTFEKVPQNAYILPYKTMCVSYNHPNIAIGSLQSRVFLFNCLSFGNQNFNREISNLNLQSYYKLKKFGQFNKILSMAIEDNYCAVGGVDGTVCVFSINRNSGDPNIPLSQKFLMLTPQKQKIVFTQKKNKSLGQANTLQFGYSDNKKVFLIVGGTFSIATYNIETLRCEAVSLKVPGSSFQRALTSTDSINKRSRTQKDVLLTCTKIKWWGEHSSIILAIGDDWSKGLYGLQKKKTTVFVKKMQPFSIQKLVGKENQ